MADSKDQRIDELLESNNRYLETSRAACEEIRRLTALVRVLMGDGSVLLMQAHTGRTRLQLRAEFTLALQGELSVAAYRVYRDGTMIFVHQELAPAYAVYFDNVENIALEPV